MKIYILIVLIIVILFSCNNDNNQLSVEINNIIKVDSIRNSLLNAYEFKYYKNGVGIDFSKPISNDSVIFLKNSFSEKLNLNLINQGKVILLDSLSICKRSFKRDKSGIVMREIGIIKGVINENNHYQISFHHWVPQYLEPVKCIELEKTEYIEINLNNE